MHYEFKKRPENRRYREQRTACTSDLPDAEIRLSSVTISEKIHPEGFTPSAQPAEQVPKKRRRLGPPYLSDCTEMRTCQMTAHIAALPSGAVFGLFVVLCIGLDLGYLGRDSPNP